MAKVVIRIEDRIDGKVKIVSDPNFETIMNMLISGSGLTSAHGYALRAINELRKYSKSQGGIFLPRKT